MEHVLKLFLISMIKWGASEMTTSLSEGVREIASKYFSDIIYIDDALMHPNNFIDKISARTEQASSAENIQDSNVTPFRRLPTKPNAIIDQREERIKQDTSVVDMSDYSRAFNLLYDFQKLGCKASPYYFESEESIDQAVKLIEISHLTILDWELDATAGETTLKLLDKALINQKRMKMMVIYTRSPEKARDNLQGKYPDSPPERIRGKLEEYYLVKLNNAIIIVCSKQNFNAEEILQTFIEQIVLSFGYFPFGFFDAINKMNDQTALILQRFSYPFDNALILQLSTSGFTENDYAQIVSKMVSNHFSKATNIDPVILKSIVSNWKDSVDILLAYHDEKLKEIIHGYISEICKIHHKGTNGKKNVKNISLLKGIDLKNWKEYLQLLKELDLSKREPFKQLKEKVLNDALDVNTNLELTKSKLIEVLESSDEIIRTTYKKLYKEKYRKEVKDILDPLIPVLLVFLLSFKSSASNIKQSVRELVDIMKVVPYETISIDRADSLNDDELTNYFSSGDVLFGKDQEALVCISPSCDAFNPADKVSYNLKFIRGKVIKKDSEFIKLKEGQHISILPNPEGKDLICVKWEFYKTKVIDIRNGFSDYRLYKRPYRFEQSYCQQIINSYLSYHSRSGVDELFFKKESSMRNFFVFPNQ